MKQCYPVISPVFLSVFLACSSGSQFTPIFDGSTLNGWEVKSGPENIWQVENGVIACEGGGYPIGWLGTVKKYRNFVFTCEWKIVENGNSGVFLRVADDTEQNPAYDSIEIQVCDDDGSEYKNLEPKEISGAIYAVAGAKKRMYNGTNRWNKYVITCSGPHITLEYNGELVLDVDARQHYKPFTWFNRERRPLMQRPREGYIALQTHGSKVWFRNIRIREIE
ncbi:MAG: DUF1080 domain-containing protein [Candidatus Latescibacteria bacterium]|nr:DUF1080 domain-containing protein [Candidatus Latescibacterota bacterium]